MLPFMVEYYFPEMSVKELGFRAGLLGSAFSMGELFGNLLWGVYADRVGRRPALMYGLAGTIISSCLFGFAPNFWVAVLARFAWGFLNGNVGVGKTYLAEILDDSNNARGMSLFSVIGGVGRTVGPMLGGFFSSPAISYPVFRGTVFELYPFALPGVLVSSTCLVVVILAWFNLSETLRMPMENGGLSRCPCPLLTQSKSGGGRGGGGGQDKGTVGIGSTSDPNSIHPGTPRKGSYSRLDTSDHAFSIDAADCERSANFASPLHSQHSSSDPSIAGGNAEKKRRVGFSNVVVVKFIGSETLAFGSLKRLSSEDQPVESQGPRGDSSDADIGQSAEGGYEKGQIMESERDYESGDDEDDEDEDEEGDGGDDNGVELVVIGREAVDFSEKGEKEVSSPLAVREKAPTPVRVQKRKGNEPLPKNKLRFSNGSEFFADSAPDDQRSSTLWGLVCYLLSKKEILLSTGLYGLNGFLQCIATEIFPLWVVTSVKDGGFGFDSSRIGIAVGISGVAIVSGNLLLYPCLVERLGVVRTYRYSTYLVAAAAILIPSASLIQNGAGGEKLACGILVLLLCFYNSAAQWVLTCVFTFINNSCYSHQRGTVNGIGQTFAAFGRMLGPYLGASLFAWTEVSQLRWPFNYFLTWYLVGTMSLIAGILSWNFSKSIQRRKREPREPRYARTMNSSRTRLDSSDERCDLIEAPPSPATPGKSR